jgi:uncharacterized protein (TIGR00255 family)
MISSMTGFARQEKQFTCGHVAIECRSVNQRYLDLHFKLPEHVRDAEPRLREKLKQNLSRGKVDCIVYFHAETAREFELDEGLVKQVMQAEARVASLADVDYTPSPRTLLRWPGVMQSATLDTDEVHDAIALLADAAITALKASRAQEGEALKACLLERITGIQKHLVDIQKIFPEVSKGYGARIKAKFEEAQIELPEERIAQEMVAFAHKIDIAEEIDRLGAHIASMQDMLKKGGLLGRKLDFLMQEFNRETNTMGSKSVHQDITAHVVEMKVLIEQMRE